MGHCGQERGRERERSDQKLAKEEEKHTPSLRSPPQCPLAHPPSLIPQPHVHTEQTAEGGGWGVLLLMRRLDPGLPTAFLHFATAVNTTLFFPSRPHRRPQLPSNKVHGPAQGSKEKETANRFHGGRRVGPCQSYLNIQDEIMAKSSPDLARESSSPASLPLPAPWQPQNPGSLPPALTWPCRGFSTGRKDTLQLSGASGLWWQGRIELGNHSRPLRALAFTSKCKITVFHL